MIKLKIDVTKVPKDRIYVGKKGKYLSLILLDNRDGRDPYGNDGIVKIDLSKDARAMLEASGERNEIIGNWNHVTPKTRDDLSTPPPMPVPASDRDDDIPF
jgi:hypothetical protein